MTDVLLSFSLLYLRGDVVYVPFGEEGGIVSSTAALTSSHIEKDVTIVHGSEVCSFVCLSCPITTHSARTKREGYFFSVSFLVLFPTRPCVSISLAIVTFWGVALNNHLISFRFI